MINITRKLLTQAFEALPNALALVAGEAGGGLRLVHANAALAQATGWQPAQLVDTALAERLVATLDWPAAGDSVACELAWRRADGGSWLVPGRVTGLHPGPSAAGGCWLVAAEPAGAHAGADTGTATQSLDAVTGLPDAASFAARLRRDWCLAAQAGQGLALLLFRVDAVDAYRELFGRHATDSCLRMVGHAIAGSLRRESDYAARADDGLFKVLVGGADARSARDLAERIARKVRSLAIHHPRSPVARFVTVSWGADAMAARPDCRPADLEAAAERELRPACVAETRRQAG